MNGHHEGSAITRWTPERLQRLQRALGIALVISLLVGYWTDADSSSALKRGDFPGLYSPAVILARGQSDRYFDKDLHYQIQTEAWPSFKGNLYISVYPPYFGALMKPLGYLSPETARAIWTAFSLICYLLALYLIRPFSAAVSNHFLFILISSLLFIPVFFGVLGGQNSALSLLLFVGGARCLASRSTTQHFLGGALFGLWLFKPQFGLIAGLYLLVTRRWTAAAGFGAVAGLYWLAAAFYLGPNWIALWSDAAAEFAPINLQINGHQMTSVTALFYSLTKLGLLPTSFWLPLATATSLLIAAIFFVQARCSIWALPALIVLISPQTLFYDLALCLAAMLPFISLDNDREVNGLLGAALFFALIFFIRDYSLFALPVIPAVLVFLFIVRHAAAREQIDYVSPNSSPTS